MSSPFERRIIAFHSYRRILIPLALVLPIRYDWVSKSCGLCVSPYNSRVALTKLLLPSDFVQRQPFLKWRNCFEFTCFYSYRTN